MLGNGEDDIQYWHEINAGFTGRQLINYEYFQTHSKSLSNETTEILSVK